MKASISASLRAPADVASSRAPCAAERRLLEDVAHRLEAAHQALEIVALGEEVRVDQRRRLRVGARQAARCRGSSAGAGRRGRSSRGRTRSSGRGRSSLPITKWSCRSGRSSSGRLLMKPPASAKLVVSRPRRCRRHSKMPLIALTAPASERPNRSFSLRRVEHLDDVDVVVQVRADAGQVVAHLDAEARAGARPGRCRRASAAAATAARRPRAAPRAAPRSCAVSPPTRDLDAAGAPAVEQHPVRVRRGHHREVGPAEVRRQVGLGDAEALAVLVRHLVDADAFLGARR